ncbi:MAG: hypothetical protein KAV45_03185 [Calditrichia bacterium]|nr:hypothetical protein [Calditrichia bacterium]
MKLKFFSFYLSLVLVLTTGCGEKIESTWKNQAFTIDGNGQDWEGSPYYLNISNPKTIKVGLEIVGMSEEEKENLKAEMEEQRKSMQEGDMGGRGRGGMRGGMRGGGIRGGGNRPQMPDMDGEEYWITVQLAVK